MECKNCGYESEGEFDYCSQCGAKVIRNRLTTYNLWRDIIHRYFDIDNTFLRTFVHLITKPEVVIDGYIHGLRKKYINPISYFAFALTLTGLQVFLIRKFFPNAYDMSAMTVSGQEEFASTMLASIQEYSSLITMLMIPVYALMARIVFFNVKKYNYTELVVVFLYFGAEIGLISFLPTMAFLVMGFSFGDMTLWTVLLQIVFAAYYLKRLYKLSTKGIVLRTFFFLVVLAVFYIAAVVVTVIIMMSLGVLPVPEG